MTDFLGPAPPRDVIHKYIFDRPDKYSTFKNEPAPQQSRLRGIFHKFILNAPHRPRLQQPGGQTELRAAARGMGRDEVILKDTYSCQHWPCNAQVSLPRGRRVEDTGGWCPHCRGIICASCMRLGKCLPLEEGMFRYEQLAKIKERMSAEEMVGDVRRQFQEVGLLPR